MKSDLFQLLYQLKLVSNEPLHSIELLNGTQHQNYRIFHPDGQQWVIKRLNTENWLGPCSFSLFEQSEHLAEKVALKTGITQAALQFNNAYVQCHDKVNYLIYPWINGVNYRHISQEQAFLLGEHLALIHHLQLKSGAFSFFPAITEQASLNLSLKHLIKRCNQVRTYQSQHFVLSHRDMNLSNVLWLNEKTLKIIDWESAGYIHPTIELVGLALNAAGIEQAQNDWLLFDACLSGYKKNGQTVLPLDKSLFYQLYHTWLAWIVFSHEHLIDTQIALEVIELIQNKQSQIIEYTNH